MALFEYSTLTENGRELKGTVEAGSSEQAREILSKMNLSINKLDSVKLEHKGVIGREEFLTFNQHLASLTRAGIPLERGLRELANDSVSNKMSQLINSIASDLEAGTSLEDAISSRSGKFPPMYNYVLHAGIRSGKLSEMLLSLTYNLEMRNKTRKMLFEAITYPLVILILGSLIVTAVFVFTVPQMREVINEMTYDGASLPYMTQIVFSASDHVFQLWLALGLIIVALFLPWRFLSYSRNGRKIREAIAFRIPVMGKLLKYGSLGMFAYSLSILIRSGNELAESFRLAGGASGSELILEDSNGIADGVERGYNLVEAGVSCRVISSLFMYSSQLGIQRNDLPQNLDSLAKMYSNQAYSTQGRLQSLLLPVMLICVGGFIALSVLAIFLPMIRVITSLM